MKRTASKINRIRSVALGLIFAGIVLMYGGIYFRSHIVVVSILMLLGTVAILASLIVYFWIGMLSTRTVQVICPGCQKPTKLLGRVDMCMHCGEPLTLDPNLEGMEFDEAYK